MVTIEARDLEADFAICEAATPGRWQHFMVPVPETAIAYPYHHGISSTRSTLVMALTGPWADEQSGKDAAFIAEARTGWPYAIRRAQEAEREADKLREEINMLHEQLQQHRSRLHSESRCYD